MTPIELQDYLIKELRMLFSEFKLQNQDGDLSSINVFTQYLPEAIESQDDENESGQFEPYVRVILLDGEDNGPATPYTCSIQFEISTYDEEKDCQGYRDCLLTINRMYKHFVEQGSIGEKFELQYPIKWQGSEDDKYPQFKFYMLTKWSIPKPTYSEIMIQRRNK